jgi:hypothetical protein
MDNVRFDRLARSLAERGTRRNTLRALGAASLAAVGARLGLAPAAAKCKQVGKKCKKGDKCCAGAKCKRKRCRCTNDSQCGDGEICLNGACVVEVDPTPCPGNQPTCGGVCCVAGQLCQNQVCVNGDLEVNDDCDPDAPGACQTGVCGCFGDNNICTCREAICGAPGAGCLFLRECCDGFCIGNAQVCSPV